ncbi:hypothetical protein DIPPA_11104 [Diplonema papillatum]|nr:hypothetical protein DIPPA_11104 [Diplonema papillatum]
MGEEAAATQPTAEEAEELYSEGAGLLSSGKVAEGWDRWQRAAAAGHPGAQYNVGVYCQQQGEHAAAAGWWYTAAMHGDSDAQCNLGVCYLKGQGVDQDVFPAVQWLHLATLAGDTHAPEVLAKLPPQIVYEVVSQPELLPRLATAISWLQAKSDLPSAETKLPEDDAHSAKKGASCVHALLVFHAESV